MGNLSNLYISSSFQSLLHLGNDSVITSSLVGIQDGFGNSVGIAVNSAGDLSLSGSFTSSLQQGYVWVGNSNGKTTTVPTSSFGGGGSATWPVSGTPSGIVSGSSQLTSSYDQRYALSGSSANINTGSFATTGSNSFVGNQFITGNLEITQTFNYIKANNLTGSWGQTNYGSNAIMKLDGNLLVNGDITASLQNGYTWVGNSSGITYQVPTSSFAGGLPVGVATTGSNIFVGEQYINGGRHLQIQRSASGPSQYLRLGPTDNENNFAFIVTGSGQNPGQQVWGINIGGGLWANSFDAGVAFNNYVSASNGIQIGRGSDDEAGRNALVISRLSSQTGIQINQTDIDASWFIGTKQTNNGNLIISSSTNANYFEFDKSNGWVEVGANQINFNNGAAFRGRLEVRNTYVSEGYQIYYPTGSNQQAGVATLNGANPGTVTVSNSLVNANSIIMLTKQTNGHSGVANISSKGSGTFTITSTANGDNDTVAWFIINNTQ
jgi:hypothetical protein